jgi:hypothetical protein
MSEAHSEAEVAGQTAACLARWGLADVALFALDAFGPLGSLAGQALWVAQPALGLLIDARQVGALAGALERPEGVELLRRSLVTARQQADQWKA